MKAAGELVVNPAASHFFERGGEHVFHMIRGGTRLLAWPVEGSSASGILINQQINHCRVRKLRRTSKSAMLLIEHLYSGIHNLLNHGGRELSGLAAE